MQLDGENPYVLIRQESKCPTCFPPKKTIDIDEDAISISRKVGGITKNPWNFTMRLGKLNKKNHERFVEITWGFNRGDLRRFMLQGKLPKNWKKKTFTLKDAAWWWYWS